MERLLRFLMRQIREMREGGLSVLLRKVTAIFMMAPAAVVVLMACMVRPLVLIRFGRLEGRNIGPFAIRPELYLCRRDAGIPDRRTLDIFFFSGSACNQQLKRMWGRILLVSPCAELPHMLARKLPGFSTHVVPINCKWPKILASKPPGLDAHLVSINSYAERDVQGLLARTPAHLSFTAEEERLGRAALRELCIPEGTPFICFLARDSAYKEFYNSSAPGGDSNRNTSIHSFVPAAEELTRRGYFALRMGAIVKEALHTTNPMIVDYATKHRTEFLDIYLAAKCRFLLGDPTGYSHCVPALFRRPLAIVNFLSLETSWSWDPNQLYIPKKLWLRKEHRFMTFREALDLKPGWVALSDAEYEQLDIGVIDNTPEEIAAVAVEMDERLQGIWRTTEEDEGLQRRFWSLFKHSKLHGVILSRVGAEFLRQNRGLLD